MRKSLMNLRTRQERVKKKLLFLSDKRVFKILIMLLLASGCSNQHVSAPVIERKVTADDRIRFHRVSEGETLFSIAWRYSKDYKALARVNGVDKNYMIVSGQKLNLDTSAPPPRKTVKKPVSKPTPTKVVTAQNNRSKTTTSPAPPVVKKKTKNSELHWKWPLRGRLLEGFSNTTGKNKGIDIDGRIGQSVLAAEAGRVVYAGSGIRGYGNLLIIKHSDVFLSAYAHNSQLLVKENQDVSLGQVIAKVGSSGTNRPKLHFEMRKNGKPVDPMHYLPSL